MNRANILLVDDDHSFLRLLTIRLESAGYRVEGASSGKQALRTLSDFSADLIVTDLKMNDMDGLSLLDELNTMDAGLPVLMITAHGTIPDAVAATQGGAISFLTKSIDKDELLAQIEKALAISGTSGNRPDWCAHIITRNTKMQALLSRAQRIAKTDSNVIIFGPSGTGKELLAAAIHKASERPGEFLAINCAAMPETLLESELFGHQRGAFTGAVRNHAGLLSAAGKGTLLLDEVGDLPLGIQAKLLRVLQERRVRPVGDQREYPIDVRIVSATHHDLKAEIVSGQFREDLYYRLNVIGFELPTLAERREDIPLLVRKKLEELAAIRGDKPKIFSPRAIEYLISTDWPGNVRQLFNTVEHCAALSPGPVINPKLVVSQRLQLRRP